ncbi:hypothetical protein AGMMS49944_13570 [Spirochaetia bacterium]|nr:hypothetical protein AGMMS49944_13570 [Spirochaetia bacterium]
MEWQDYFHQLLNTIKEKDPLHYERIIVHVNQSVGQKEFEELCILIIRYCNESGVNPEKLAEYFYI